MTKLRVALGMITIGAPIMTWIGCGSGDAVPISPTGSDAGDASDVSTAADTAADTTTPGNDSGTVTPGTDAGADAADTGSANDAATLPEGSVVADGGQNLQDAAQGGTPTSLSCGAAVCAIPGESCCVSSGNGGLDFSCVVGTSAACPGAGNDVIGLKCSSSANCGAAEQCCANIAPNDVVQSACVPIGTCDEGPGGGEFVVLCDPNAASSGCGDAGACATGSGSNLEDWGLPNGFGICGNRPGPF